MILPTYSDEQILNELKDDWPSVKKQAKKFADKLLKRRPTYCIGIDKDCVSGGAIRHRSKNGNTWNISIYAHKGSSQWYSVCYAEVENKYGKKSYYYLRGMNRPFQYYCELTPHAIRRIRERFVNEFQERPFADMNVTQLADFAVFDRHECGIFMKSGRVYGGKFHQELDEDGNTRGIVLLKNAMFYARRTPAGNFIFKTFILPDIDTDAPKKEYIMLLFGIYLSHNIPKGEGSNDERAMLLAKMACASPFWQRYLNHYSEIVVPLYS